MAKINVEDAWEKLFDECKIVDEVEKNGFYKIKANKINEYKEARLMAKFDQSSALPSSFKKNSLSILPTMRGEYIIGHFKTHFDLEYPNSKPIPVEIPDLESIDPKNLYSESSALLFALNSGMVNDVLETDVVNLTVNGRMSSGSFEYSIDNILKPDQQIKIGVANSQIEIDSGFESPTTFCICEAKNIKASEILIRQLYYPFRLWENKISKKITPVFLVSESDNFHFFIYEFKDKDMYNSLELVNYKLYTIADENVYISEIRDLLLGTSVIEEPSVTFPQADSFERIVDLLSLLYNSPATNDEITTKYVFESRQTSYYVSACEYLGLITRGNNSQGEREYSLSPLGYKIMGYTNKNKMIELIRLIIQRPVFNEALKLTLKNGIIPDRRSITRIMKEKKLHYSDETLKRRAQSVKGWIDWILGIAIVE